MIRQDAPELFVTKRFACYFMTLGNIGEEVAGKRATAQDVMKVYARCVENKIMGWDCFLGKPNGEASAGEVLTTWLQYLGSSATARYVGWWNHDTGHQFWDGERHNFVVDRYPWGKIKHFNRRSFDPHPGLTLGTLNGQRFFMVEGI